MPGMSLIQPFICVLNVLAQLTLRQDGCHTLETPHRVQQLHNESELVREYSFVGNI